jgi:hypothetical protein
MSLLRKDRINLGRINLTNIVDLVHLLPVLETYINRFIDLFENEGVVLPVEEFSPDPENGELLFDGSKLYLAIDGTYHQVYPSDGSTSSSSEEGTGTGGGGVSCTYSHYVEDTKWAQVDCSVNDSTVLVTGVSGKRLCIVYLHFSNSDTSDGKEIYLTLEDDTTDYFKQWIPAEGVVVQNFTRANPITKVGKKISATVSNDGSDDIYVTIGYLELDEV